MKSHLPYEPMLKTLKANSNISITSWQDNYVDYNTKVDNDYYKSQNAIYTKDIKSNKTGIERLNDSILKDIKDNDKIIIRETNILDNLLKKYTTMKNYNETTDHTKTAASQLKKDKEMEYTASTLGLVLQFVGLIGLGGFAYSTTM